MYYVIYWYFLIRYKKMTRKPRIYGGLWLIWKCALLPLYKNIKYGIYPFIVIDLMGYM